MDLAPGTRPLELLFRPRSVTVVGASGNPRKLGGEVFRNLVEYRFPGEIMPVNRGGGEIGGKRCYVQVGDLPHAVDLAVIAVQGQDAYTCALELMGQGTKALIVLSRGFDEEATAEGRRRGADLARHAAAHGVALVGPNCAGLINTSVPLVASTASSLRVAGLKAGPIAVITQSGAIGSAVLAHVRQRRLGVSSWVSVGNASVLSFADYLTFAAQDDATSVIALYVEGLTDGEGPHLLQAARSCLQAGKPVVILKGGVSAAGGSASKTHTGALSGDRETWRGVARQTGIVWTDSLGEFLDTVTLMSVARRPRGPRVALVTNSGGTGVLATDAMVNTGLELATYGAATRDHLAHSNAFGAAGNPLDLTGVFDVPGSLRAIVESVVRDENVDSTVVLGGIMDEDTPRLLDEIISAGSAADKPVLVSWSGCSTQDAADAWERGLGVVNDPARAVSVLGRLTGYWSTRPELLMRSQPREPGDPVRVSRNVGSQRSAVDDPVKLLLREGGIEVPESLLARTLDDAVRYADRLGYPVALKVASAAVIHKTDVGGVVVDVAGREAVVESWTRIMTNVHAAIPGVPIDGVYVEQMVPRGLEMLIGISRDPQFGPVVTMGLGGVWAELLAEVTVRALPVRRDDVIDMWSSLLGGRLRTGLRGVVHNSTILQDAALRLIDVFTLQGERIEALEVNPLIVSGERAIAVDVRAVWQGPRGGDGHRYHHQ